MQNLLFDDFQHFHGASLDADAAGNALCSGALSRLHHDLHGTNFNALTAGGAELLVDHVHTGLGVLGDGTGFANLGAFAALDAGHGLCSAVFLHDLDAGQVFVEFLEEGSGTGTDTLQACHALYILFNSKLFHTDRNPLF